MARRDGALGFHITNRAQYLAYNKWLSLDFSGWIHSNQEISSFTSASLVDKSRKTKGPVRDNNFVSTVRRISVYCHAAISCFSKRTRFSFG